MLAPLLLERGKGGGMIALISGGFGFGVWELGNSGSYDGLIGQRSGASCADPRSVLTDRR
jgi:hypothetical protein